MQQREIGLPNGACDGRRPLAAGCDDHDTKPVDIARLLDKIRALLDQPSV